MPRDSTLAAPPPEAPQPSQLRLGPLMDLLEAQDPAMRRLFAKALNIYVSPGAEALHPLQRFGPGPQPAPRGPAAERDSVRRGGAGRARARGAQAAQRRR